MTAIDRAALIEAAAEAISYHQGSFILVPEQPTRPSPSQVRLAEAVVPSTVAAALKPIRELHREQFQFCRDCDADYPCPTIQLCDEIEVAAKGGDE